MLVSDPSTGEICRIFSGVTDCEVTGITVTPDRRTMFVNLQHPGDGDPQKTNFPAPQGSGKVPRDATIVITRKNGGIVGS
jgi:secreted PhoX family phosphatase